MDVKINNQDKIKATYDLSEFPKIFNTKENGNYKSNFFIYQSKIDNVITLKSFEELKIVTAKISSNDKDILNNINEFLLILKKKQLYL